jgi:hypothetical protein
VTEWFWYEVVGYPNHQLFLYETITYLREKGINDVHIEDGLNENGHKIPRGKIFRNNHVHSIVKMRKNQ